jgi:hypothetical protein
MITLLGSLLGFFGSAVPQIFEFFQKKEKNKLDLQLMQMQAELLKQSADIDLMKFKTRALDDEHARLIEHDIAMQKDTGIAAGLRKSVRPVITYLFFALFALVKVSTLWVAWHTDASFHQAVLLVWDSETQGIFAAIISFWFGSRALEKRAGKS